MIDKNTYLKQWSEKLSKPIAEIEKEFQTFVEETGDEQTALKKMHLEYKKMLRTPAIGFEGVIIGVSDCVDVVARKKKDAEELFKQDPQLAVTQGVTDEDGVPLDTRQQFASGKDNPQFGKPLPENSFLRNIWGIAKKANSQGQPKFFQMTLNGAVAENENVPIFKPVRLMAIDRSQQQEEYTLNASQFTEFTIDETLNIGKIEDLVKNVCQNKVIKLGDLAQYHEQNKDNFGRLAIVVGDVAHINPEPTAFGSIVMGLEDLDELDIEAPGLTCWLPLRVDVDFKEGSKVIAVGRTSQGKKKDENGNVTEELADVTMNCYGVYAIPEFKIEEDKPNLD